MSFFSEVHLWVWVVIGISIGVIALLICCAFRINARKKKRIASLTQSTSVPPPQQSAQPSPNPPPQFAAGWSHNHYIPPPPPPPLGAHNNNMGRRPAQPPHQYAPPSFSPNPSNQYAYPVQAAPVPNPAHLPQVNTYNPPPIAPYAPQPSPGNLRQGPPDSPHSALSRNSASHFDPDDLISFEVTGDDKESPCPICLGPLKDEVVSTGQCLHLVHTSCLKSWLVKDDHTACPVCRVPYQDLGDDDEYHAHPAQPHPGVTNHVALPIGRLS